MRNVLVLLGAWSTTRIRMRMFEHASLGIAGIARLMDRMLRARECGEIGAKPDPPEVQVRR